MTDYSTWTDEQLDLALVERLYGIRECRIDSSDEIYGIKGNADKGTVVNAHGRRPTRDAHAMFDVIAAMHKRGWWCRIDSPISQKWHVSFIETPIARTHMRGHETTPMRAVAVAALKALDRSEG